MLQSSYYFTFRRATTETEIQGPAGARAPNQNVPFGNDNVAGKLLANVHNTDTLYNIIVPEGNILIGRAAACWPLDFGFPWLPRNAKQ